ncbi:hypothetical protein Ancab_037584 [Ancistrocladus abbreviatus]
MQFSMSCQSVHSGLLFYDTIQQLCAPCHQFVLPVYRFLTEAICMLLRWLNNSAIQIVKDCLSVIGAHLEVPTSERRSQVSTRTCPPVTTHVLDIGRGCPAFGIEVRLEIWKGKSRPFFEVADLVSWML